MNFIREDRIRNFDQMESYNATKVGETERKEPIEFDDFGSDLDGSAKTTVSLKLVESLELGKKNLKNFKLFKDSVHGTLEFSKQHLAIIDHPLFQRLRNLKQLGATCWVYPGATHTRFEHSLGVGFLSQKYLRILKEHDKSIECSDEDGFLVGVAGLCHDLGHGPFSHTFEKWMRSRGTLWHHEDYSVSFLEQIVNDCSIDFTTDQVTFVKDLIKGNSRKKDERTFLYDIVANTKTGVDTDKFDYIARDGFYTGYRTNFDIDRILNGTRVIDGELCYNRSDAINLYNLFANRSNLHLQVYGHKTTCAIENMIFDILTEANPILGITERPHQDLGDDILYEIERSKKSGLEKAKQLIDRIHRRNFYRSVTQFILPTALDESTITDNLTPKKLAEHSKSMKPHDFVVHQFSINHGMQDRNPISSIRFFEGWDSNKCYSLRNDEISSFLPVKYSEKRYIIYVKDPAHRDQAKIATYSLLDSMGCSFLL